ncbi:serine hydrolase [Actinoplanes sp. L3-i22]|uniref:serine hydrolase domain-containing protein n=1 Tax=Actinoplanes sp. L3-i22 TaxID=2836373 RepID=UPI001C744213|nr:serine hydrolase domain-containing protein [Actinoplanes sp. L3-i22]BCY08894.1 FmtA-like protein [Actinoplanes sp. L3-i22]
MRNVGLQRALTIGVLAAALSVAAVPAASAAPARAVTPDLTGVGQLVDRVVAEQLSRDRIPGAAVVVVAGGKQVFAKGYGVSNVAAGTPVDADSTAFFTASVAKVFTATAMAQLIQQGRIDPDADVNKYLKTFQVRNTFPGHPVTAQSLLTHTAGFDDAPTGAAVADPADVPELGAYLAAHQPERIRPPGLLAQYDNYGVALAGYLVETVSGEPFAEYVQHHILTPLAMNDTTFVQPHPATIQARLAQGYRPVGDKQIAEQGQYGAWSPTGAGTVATATDIGRLMTALLDDSPSLGAGVAQAVKQQHFTMDPRLPGMAWMLQEEPRNGRPLLFKDGDLPGFHTNLEMLPEQDLGVYVVYNGDGTGGLANWDGKDLINQIIDRYVPGSPAAPKAVSGTDTSGLAGQYRIDRTSHTQVTRVVALVSPITVAVHDDGTVTTDGIALDPNAQQQRWYPIGPRLFQQVGGQARIAFDGKGNLFSTQDPSVAYQRLAWYSSPVAHQIVLVTGLLVLLLAVVWFPVMALVRRSRGRQRHSRWAQGARLAAWLTGALAAGFTGWFLMMATDFNALTETVLLGTPALTAMLALNTVAAGTTAVLLVGTGAAWTRGWWTVKGRLAYTVTTVAALGYLGVAFLYNLIGWLPLG